MSLNRGNDALTRLETGVTATWWCVVPNLHLLRILEAVEYYGIGIKRLRRIAEEGEHIFAVQVENNRWMIHRRKFEEYLNTYYFSGKKYEGDIPVKVF